MTKNLSDLKDQTIELSIITPWFHGKTAGRVREIPCWSGPDAPLAYWVGDFCFRDTPISVVDSIHGEYKEYHLYKASTTDSAQ